MFYCVANRSCAQLSVNKKITFHVKFMKIVGFKPVWAKNLMCRTVCLLAIKFYLKNAVDATKYV